MNRRQLPINNTNATHIGRPVKRRGLGAVAVAVSMGLGLAACSPVVGGQSGRQSGNEPEPPTVALVNEMPPQQAVTVEGLQGQRVIHSTGSAARWANIPANRAFNQLVSDVVAAQLQAQAATRDATYSPEVYGIDAGLGLDARGCVEGTSFAEAQEILSNPELSPTADGDVLSVTCDAVLAKGDAFAQRLRFVRGNSEGVTSDTVETIYTNLETGEAARESDLLSDEGTSAFYGALGAQINKKIGMDADVAVPAATPELVDKLRASISNVAFAADNTATVRLDPAFESDYLDALADSLEPQSDDLINDEGADQEPVEPADPIEMPEPEALYVRIPPELIDEYFTPLGASISEAVSANEDFAGLPAEQPGKRFVECSLVPCVAITFDDGPGGYTPGVVDDLAAADATATFFMLGQNVEAMPDIAKMVADAGHEVANHSWSHPQLTALSSEDVAWQINSTNDAIESATGIRPTILRPPYGAWNDAVLAAANMPEILWSIDTNDWQKPGDAALISQVVDGSYPGAIVLMHDIHETTTRTVSSMFTPLQQRGFTLVTVEQLYNGGPTEVAVYYGLD